MTNKKVIDMSQVVGSDTLCVPRAGFFLDHDDVDEHIGSRVFYSNYIREDEDEWDISNIEVAEGIWQSCANNLVIPDGLVVDVQYLHSDGYLRIKKNVKSGEWLIGFSVTHILTAIKITGVQEGYRYAWVAEDV